MYTLLLTEQKLVFVHQICHEHAVTEHTVCHHSQAAPKYNAPKMRIKGETTLNTRVMVKMRRAWG